MKAYKFRLETILLLKKARAKAAADKYRKAIRETKEAEERHIHLKQDKEAYVRDLGVLRQGRFSRDEQMGFMNRIAFVDKEVSRVSNLIGRLRQEEIEAMHDFLDKKKEEDVLEKLKSKRSEIYFRELIKKEDREVEEIVYARVKRMK